MDKHNPALPVGLPAARRLESRKEIEAWIAERRRVLGALLEAGVADQNIVDQTEVSRTTLWRIRRELVDTSNRARNPALQWAEDVSKRPTMTRRSSGSAPPAWGVSADSGSVDDRPLRRLLGEVA